MKDVLLHLDVVELHAPDFDYDIDGSGNSPTATHQDISTGPNPSSSSQYKSTDYRLSPLLSDKETPISGFIPLILYGYTVTQQMTKATLICVVSNVTGSTGLDWQIEEDNYHVPHHLQSMIWKLTDTASRVLHQIWRTYRTTQTVDWKIALTSETRPTTTLS